MASENASDARLDVLGVAQDWKESGRTVAIATVVETWGSAPRPVGSHLVIDGEGNFEGSVSGGCVEGAVIVGENTGGVMKVGEMRRYRLPRSQIHLTLGHQSHTDPFGAFREGRGFVPDVWLDGEDPEGDVRAVAECLARDDCPLRFR